MVTHSTMRILHHTTSSECVTTFPCSLLRLMPNCHTKVSCTILQCCTWSVCELQIVRCGQFSLWKHARQTITTSVKWWTLVAPLCYSRQWTPTRWNNPRCRWLLRYIFKCEVVEPALRNVRQIHIYIHNTYRVRVRVCLVWQWSPPIRLWI